MPRVFVNGISAKSGGGRSILTNFLKIAREADDNYSYVVAVPSVDGYLDLANDRVKLRPMGRQSNTMLIPFASAISLPRLCKQERCDIVFNLSDIPMRTSTPQVFLFDWPYAAFPNSSAWRLSTRRDRLIRAAKLFFFKLLLPYVDITIAQNHVLAEQLRLNYDLNKIPIVPNAVSLDNLSNVENKDFALGDSFNFLCLSKYYSHKNLEVFIPLAERIKASGLQARIIITISPDENAGAVALLDEINARKLDDIIINVGSVAMEHVPSLYEQTHALLLPTLLESFSGTYVEAMHHRKPIFTSQLPFASGVCGNSAYYFDPNDAESIFDCLKSAIDDPASCLAKVDEATRLLKELPSWKDAYGAYTKIFKLGLQDNK